MIQHFGRINCVYSARGSASSASSPKSSKGQQQPAATIAEEHRVAGSSSAAASLCHAQAAAAGLAYRWACRLLRLRLENEGMPVVVWQRWRCRKMVHARWLFCSCLIEQYGWPWACMSVCASPARYTRATNDGHVTCTLQKLIGAKNNRCSGTSLIVTHACTGVFCTCTHACSGSNVTRLKPRRAEGPRRSSAESNRRRLREARKRSPAWWTPPPAGASLLAA